MQKAVEAIEAFIDGVGKLTLWITLLMIGLVATNVLLRYSMSVGSVWAQELEWHLLAPLILFGIPYALFKGEHVRVDVFFEKFSASNQQRVEIVSQALGILIALAFAWLSFRYFQQSFAIGEKSSDPGGLPYRWALKALLPAGFILLALQSFATLLGAVEKLRASPQRSGASS